MRNNPADHASRGLHANDLVHKFDWWHGPEFLWKPLDEQPFGVEEISESDPEMKQHVTHVIKTNTFQPFSLASIMKLFP